MSSFIYFIFVIAIAVVLARYNESNKLFWTLIISLMTGMAGWTFYHKLTTCDKTEDYTLVSPIQGLPTYSDTTVSLAEVLLVNNQGLVPKPVSKDVIFEYYDENVECPSVSHKETPSQPTEYHLRL